MHTQAGWCTSVDLTTLWILCIPFVLLASRSTSMHPYLLVASRSRVANRVLASRILLLLEYLLSSMHNMHTRSRVVLARVHCSMHTTTESSSHTNSMYTL